MATRKGDYFGLNYLISLFLAIFLPTSWIFGFLTRLQEGKIVAGIIRIFFGWNIIWLCDLILMIVDKHILRVLDI